MSGMGPQALMSVDARTSESLTISDRLLTREESYGAAAVEAGAFLESGQR
jgi:hypothetical protein